MNVAIILGWLTRDPAIKTSQSGMTIARFTLAVNRLNKKGQNPETDFISCIAFGKTAEVISTYCHKGQRILIDGRIQTGSYTDKAGNKKYTTDVIVNHMEFIERRETDKPSAQNGTKVGFEDMGTVVRKDPEPMKQEEIPF